MGCTFFLYAKESLGLERIVPREDFGGGRTALVKGSRLDLLVFVVVVVRFV